MALDLDLEEALYASWQFFGARKIKLHSVCPITCLLVLQCGLHVSGSRVPATYIYWSLLEQSEGACARHICVLETLSHFFCCTYMMTVQNPHGTILGGYETGTMKPSRWNHHETTMKPAMKPGPHNHDYETGS